MVDYRKLEIYQLAHKYVVMAYPFVDKLPPEEDRNIKSQLRRAMLSFPLNIAEGCAKSSVRNFYSHLNYALASAREVEALLLICKDLYLLDEDDIKVLSKHLDLFTRKLVCFMKLVEKDCNKKKFNNWRRVSQEVAIGG